MLADLGRAPDPLADRAGNRGDDQADHARADNENKQCADPGRNAVSFRRLNQRRQRQRQNRRGQDRHHEGVTDIKEGAEQEEKYADGRGLAGRGPHFVDIVDRQRIADYESMTDFALGSEIFQKTLRSRANSAGYNISLD